MSVLPTPHVAIVLAAGGSRRLGRPKQLLTREGETLVHRAVRLVIETSAQEVIVVCGAYSEKVGAAIDGMDMEIVMNPAWETGLASSLRAAQAALAPSDAQCLIVACDQPALEREHLQRLLTGASESRSGCAATLHAGHGGVPAVVTANLLRLAHELRGDRGLREALDGQQEGSMWYLDAPELHFDIDIPKDIEQAVADGLLDEVLL